MKFKLFIVSLFVVCILLPGFILANDKVVVVPLLGADLDTESLRALCRGYDVVGKTPPAEFRCPPKLVFVTSENYYGNLGGVPGADAICQQHADESGLTSGRTFKAWISANGSSPVAAFVKSQTPYELVNGTRIADNWADLVTNESGLYLDATIEVDENGENVSSYIVWTATATDGTYLEGVPFLDRNCNGWTTLSNSYRGVYGIAVNRGEPWTDQDTRFCGSQSRLYCFEQ